MNELIHVFVAALLVSAVWAWPIYRALIALKSRQTVSQHVAEHAHKQGTPTMGGLIILVGALAGLIYWTTQHSFAEGLPILLMTIGYAFIGFVDDFVLPRVKKGSRGLGWIPKLVLQIGIAVVVVLLGKPYSAIDAAFAVFLVLFFSNAFNFTDGLDWLAGTVLVALSIGLICIAFQTGHTRWAVFLGAFLGGTIPFLVLNRPPAKIFMGDVGSMPIGGVLGLAFAALASPATSLSTIEKDVFPLTQPPLVWVGLIVLSVVMFIELLPPPLQILSVKLRGKRLFPMTPIHHAFQKAGWPETRIVAMFFAIQVVAAIVGVFLVSRAVS